MKVIVLSVKKEGYLLDPRNPTEKWVIAPNCWGEFPFSWV